MEQERPPGPPGGGVSVYDTPEGEPAGRTPEPGQLQGVSLPGILESVRRPVFVLKVERVPAIAGRTRAGSKRGYFMSVSQILAYIIYHASMCEGL